MTTTTLLIHCHSYTSVTILPLSSLERTSLSLMSLPLSSLSLSSPDLSHVSLRDSSMPSPHTPAHTHTWVRDMLAPYSSQRFHITSVYTCTPVTPSVPHLPHLHCSSCHMMRHCIRHTMHLHTRIRISTSNSLTRLGVEYNIPCLMVCAMASWCTRVRVRVRVRHHAV